MCQVVLVGVLAGMGRVEHVFYVFYRVIVVAVGVRCFSWCACNKNRFFALTPIYIYIYLTLNMIVRYYIGMKKEVGEGLSG